MDVLHSNIFVQCMVLFLNAESTILSANERKKRKYKKLIKALLCVFCVHLRTNKKFFHCPVLLRRTVNRRFFGDSHIVYV